MMQISVNAARRTLTARFERKCQHLGLPWSTKALHLERAVGHFERIVTLPENANLHAEPTAK